MILGKKSGNLEKKKKIIPIYNEIRGKLSDIKEPRAKYINLIEKRDKSISRARRILKHMSEESKILNKRLHAELPENKIDIANCIEESPEKINERYKKAWGEYEDLLD
jgi:glycine cleavage system H lipoate-binding protein